MNNNIAGVYENPIGLRQAFHGHSSATRVFEFFLHFSGHPGHMPGGTAGSNDHEIRQGRLAGEINDHNILGLVVIECGFNQFKQLR